MGVATTVDGASAGLHERPVEAATSEAFRSTNLDIVRAVAALAVLTGHSYILSGHYLNPAELRPDHLLLTNMAAGVWLFFALSGYLIAGPHIAALAAGRPLPDLRSYALRRVSRIYPLYLVAFLIAALVAPISPISHWWQWPVHLTLLHNLVPGEEQAVLFASWTLTIEALFYLVVPIAARAVRRVHPGPIGLAPLTGGVLALWAGSLVLTAMADVVQPTHIKVGLWLRFLLPSTLCMFCPGLLVSVAALHREDGRVGRVWRSLRDRPLAWLALAGVFGLMGCLLETRTWSSFIYDAERIPFAVASGIVVALAVAQPERRSLPFRIGAALGLVSYGIYLWQAVILQIVFPKRLWLAPLARTGPLPLLVHWLYLLALTLVLSTVSWFVLERPVMTWARQYARRQRQRRLTGPAGPPLRPPVGTTSGTERSPAPSR
ncbi:MAG TPA: acyltransferase [Acidimicrobiales bacterium]|nr:acyltransferase [Acidimicrobiales bacterium]